MSKTLQLTSSTSIKNRGTNLSTRTNKDMTNRVFRFFINVIITVSAITALGACSSANKPLDTSKKAKPIHLIEVELQEKDEFEDITVSGARIVHQEFISKAIEQKRTRVMADFARPQLDGSHYQTNTENYLHTPENGVMSVAQHPVSTFSVDVDTGSYANTRRMLNQGQLPPGDAIRLEELLNYFDYQYPVPNSDEQPFSVNSALSISPWNSERHLLRVALKGYQPNALNSKGSNLVFLLDVSGSMSQANKLPLLKRSLKMLTQQLSAKDKVSIVVYAGASGMVLSPTAGNRTADIAMALDKLSAGGSTNGGAGIELAYQLAQQEFIQGGVNRVILATDGDFNVGTVNHQQLIDLIKYKRKQGIALTTLGFGQGNYNDHLMEQLADAGNGNYAYIDTLNEARKVLVDELSSTMQIIAKDVKIQVEFNPANVAEYRLIGYENRKLGQQDFNNDNVDAGDIGAGHKVTAFYELTLRNSKDKFSDPLRYQNKQLPEQANFDELALVKLRYKQPESDTSELLSKVVNIKDIDVFANQSDDFRFATAVLGFGQLLKQSKYVQNMDFKQVRDMANNAKGRDDFGYRGEFVQLVRSAQILMPATTNNDASEVESALNDELTATTSLLMAHHSEGFVFEKEN
ncbi:MAG: Ca-activated chloride channel family protein [Paraglaciecola sp.]|jgi:Ca-activated chloride channel family protein